MLARQWWLVEGFCMKKTPFFKGFHHLCGRAKKSASKALIERLEKIRTMGPGQLCSLFGAEVRPEKIEGGARSRNRVYSPAVTFWLMLGQAFRGGSLRDAVREAQASFAELGGVDIKGATGSYSDARKRLSEKEFHDVNARVCARLPQAGELLNGRRIMVVDGTGVQLQDTPLNQDSFPQPSNQKPGCGFPVAQLLVLMNLESAAVHHYCHSPIEADESGVFLSELLERLHCGDVFLADRGFCSFLEFATLAARGVDALTRLHSSRQWPANAKGEEALVQWDRPPLSACPEHVGEKEWNQLPASMTVRYVRRTLRRKGFRPRTIMVVTTLLEAGAEEILEVYARRWEIELSIDDIKTTMGLDFVSAKTPEMAAKVITTHIIAYNLIRTLMHRAAIEAGGLPRRISCKGALDAIQRFASAAGQGARKTKAILQEKLLQVIASDLLPLRPARIEPRARKRRPKPFPIMTKPRHQLRAEIVDAQLMGN